MNTESQTMNKFFDALSKLTQRTQVQQKVAQIETPASIDIQIAKTTRVAPRISKRPARIMIPAVRVHNERLQEIELLRYKAPRHEIQGEVMN